VYAYNADGRENHAQYHMKCAFGSGRVRDNCVAAAVISCKLVYIKVTLSFYMIFDFLDMVHILFHQEVAPCEPHTIHHKNEGLCNEMKLEKLGFIIVYVNKQLENSIVRI
jgi:hypothetical protein